MVVDFMEMMKKIIRFSNVNLTVIKQSGTDMNEFDMGLRKVLLQEEGHCFIKSIYEGREEGFIYYIKDYFEVEYCVLRIPEEERGYGDFIILGPYRDQLLSEFGLKELISQKAIPIDYINELKEYYNAVPVLSNVVQWRELCAGMAGILYKGKVRMEYVRQDDPQGEFRDMNGNDILSFKMIEERYAVEAKILKAITNGNIEEALKQMNLMGKYKIAGRYKDPVRNMRSGLIIANTLWRKAAESGCVHPAYIDQLSTQIAKKVEMIESEQEYLRFIMEMLRKYCMLVRNYSLRGCSPVIQKVVNHINLNLTEDLSLKRLSVEYSVNASYLSALFKKEIGVNLTDYIIRQRVRRAIMLLNSTNMSIQDVASESGIYDVNYFRKLFKKVTGMTPTDYVKQVKKKHT